MPNHFYDVICFLKLHRSWCGEKVQRHKNKQMSNSTRNQILEMVAKINIMIKPGVYEIEEFDMIVEDEKIIQYLSKVENLLMVKNILSGTRRCIEFNFNKETNRMWAKPTKYRCLVETKIELLKKIKNAEKGVLKGRPPVPLVANSQEQDVLNDPTFKKNALSILFGRGHNMSIEVSGSSFWLEIKDPQLV